VIDESLFALDAGILDFADLLTVKSLPPFRVKLLIEGNDSRGVEEIDKGVAHIAFVLKVDGQIQKVISPRMVAIEGLEEHVLVVLVGNVAHH